MWRFFNNLENLFPLYRTLQRFHGFFNKGPLFFYNLYQAVYMTSYPWNKELQSLKYSGLDWTCIENY